MTHFSLFSMACRTRMKGYQWIWAMRNLRSLLTTLCFKCRAFNPRTRDFRYLTTCLVTDILVCSLICQPTELPHRVTYRIQITALYWLNVNSPNHSRNQSSVFLTWNTKTLYLGIFHERSERTFYNGHDADTIHSTQLTNFSRGFPIWPPVRTLIHPTRHCAN
jgi:hypothetical protein